MHLLRCDVAILITTARSVFARDVDMRIVSNERRSTAVIPAPIVVPPSQYFEGVDGSWSTFNIRVGTPAQNVRVIASTNSPDTIVVQPQGCLITAIPEGVPTNCAYSRGGTFDHNQSTTWSDQGWFALNGGNGVGFEGNLGYDFNLDYGLDTLALGFQDGPDSPTLTNQTVAAYNLPKPLYFGLFGLGTQPVLYSSFGNYSALSFFKSLRNQNMIPSLSWSYTAGAIYRGAGGGQYAQIVFGGSDTSRYQPNGVHFTVAEDITRDLVVGIQSITYNGATTKALLLTPSYAFIESTDPNIWLPLESCLLFEEAFGITWDNSSSMYLINDTQYTALSAANPTVTFRLAISTTGGSTVDIVLPFSAFGLKAQYPFVPNTTYYFPLQRAANETQYTLGRTFLQEAYLTVDYDRGNFSVSQCTWIQGATPQIATILSPSYTNSTNGTSIPSPTPAAKQNLTGAIVGGVVGGIIVIAICAAGFWRYRRQRAQLAKLTKEKEERDAAASIAVLTLPKEPEDENKAWGLQESQLEGPYSNSISKRPESMRSYHNDTEMATDGHEIYQMAVVERPGEVSSGTDGDFRHELDSRDHAVELDATPPNLKVPTRIPSPVSPLSMVDKSKHGESIGSVSSDTGSLNAGLGAGLGTVKGRTTASLASYMHERTPSLLSRREPKEMKR